MEFHYLIIERYFSLIPCGQYCSREKPDVGAERRIVQVISFIEILRFAIYIRGGIIVKPFFLNSPIAHSLAELASSSNSKSASGRHKTS